MMRRLDDLRRLADRCQSSGLSHTARELRAIADANDPEVPDDRPCPVQEPKGGRVVAIPWGLAERLYPAYGHDQTLERLAERGGFSRGELGMLSVGMYSGERSLIRGGFQTSYPLLDLYLEAQRVRGGPG